MELGVVDCRARRAAYNARPMTLLSIQDLRKDHADVARETRDALYGRVLTQVTRLDPASAMARPDGGHVS